MARIIKAKTAGFCLGVSLALKKLNETIKNKKGKKIFTLGPIIHNPQVLDYYRKKGVEPIEEVENIPAGSCVVIRAHGIPNFLEEKLKQRGVEIVDATCPKVKKAQLLITKQSSKGKNLLLFGEKTHPEVKGLLSYAKNKAIVFENLDEFKNILTKIKEKNFFLAAQTTQDRKEYNGIVNLAKKEIDPDIVALNTICDTTRERQKEASEIAKIADIVVVVGGYNSGNTRRLTKVVTNAGCKCLHVETASEIKEEHLKGCETVGLTAGASTPDYIIEQVEQKIKEILNIRG